MKIVAKQVLLGIVTGKIVTNNTLKKINITVGALYTLFGVIILLFSVPHNLPLNATFLTSDSLQTKLLHTSISAPGIHQLSMLNIACTLAAYFFVGALFHLLIGTVCRKKYEARIKKGINPFRWAEYAVSASIMLSTIAMLAGIYDFSTLILIVVLISTACIAGYAIEVTATRQQVAQRRLSAIIAIITGYIPWGVIVCCIACTIIFGAERVSTYIYSIVASTIIFFGAIGANAYLIMKKRSHWVNYAYGECWYILLSFIVKTLLAWQIFVAVLHS